MAIRDDASSFFGSRSAMESAKTFNREILQEKSIPVGSHGSSYPGSKLVSRNQLACHICNFFLKPFIAFNCVLVPVYAHSTRTRVEG